MAAVAAAAQARRREMMIKKPLPRGRGFLSSVASGAAPAEFVSLYPRLAGEYKVRLVPFFLDRVIARRDWFQPDRIHPTAAAQPALLDTVWPQLQPLLKRGVAR
ncbi:hypothetical protein J2T05_003700 [Cupriavidus necator]|nr:hypothetical protein [Cupriavidus necator]